ncbi:MAG: peroxide stress protein YaaA [Salinivirgaceae bacterium]|nr:peroxide stress protein YaaA [Salinivirgaceae bacterium]
MLIVLSPAKTLDFENARIVKQDSVPEFQNEAKTLVKLLKNYKADELMHLMSISDKLATLNVSRFKTWNKEIEKQSDRQALCAFQGDVYTGLNVADWQDANFIFAQEHLRILSGLYGVLRPLDYIKPYRLEMDTKLDTKKGESLYAFWGDKINKTLQKQLDAQGDRVLINLASNEYYKAVQEKKLKAEIITPVFKDFKNGEYKLISFFAKKARGQMSRFIIKNELTKPEQLKEFAVDGYYYNDKLTKGNQWAFTRDKN